MAGNANEKQVWETEDYLAQKRQHWPRHGKHILAQFDRDTIVVYQAFNPAIAEYAVENQRFGGKAFSFERMSWIKTNFLWMMYRCGWCSKKNQERVLAVRITKEGFAQILANAYTIGLQKSKKISTDNIGVRLQWDPDHTPKYGKLERRAIQLGLKGEILRRYATEWVVQIDDVTRFVKEQHVVLEKKGEENLTVARERVFTEVDPNTAARIELDLYEADSRPTVVRGFTPSAGVVAMESGDVHTRTDTKQGEESNDATGTVPECDSGAGRGEGE